MTTPSEKPPSPEAVEEGMSGTGRVRRAIQKFGFEEAANEDEAFTPPVGHGTKVRDMEAVAERISRMGKKDVETIKSLYSIMYNRRFQQKNMKTIKEHIVEFSGIPEADDKTRQQLVAKIGRWMRSYLQEVMDVLDVDRSKKSFDEQGKAFSKESLIHRLIDWLVDPHEKEGKKKTSSIAKKKSPRTKTKAPTAGSKRKQTARPVASLNKKAKTASTATTAAPADADDNTESEHDEPSTHDECDSEYSGDEDTKSTPAHGGGRRETSATQSSQCPTTLDANTGNLTAEMRKKVKDIIANGNTEELTVKKIVRQLSEELGEDLSAQKPAIKKFITHLQM